MAEATTQPFGWERAMIAAEKVKQRLRRAVTALDVAGVPYAVVGGNAVAEWVGRIDEDAVRNTRDVDLLIRRTDFPAASAALEAAGFVYHHLLDIDVFIDGPQGKPSGGIHLLYAGEKVRHDDDQLLPEIDESERGLECQVVSLEALVRIKLSTYRTHDRVHILDLLAVGLLDHSWPSRLPAPLGDRLQALLDNPNG